MIDIPLTQDTPPMTSSYLRKTFSVSVRLFCIVALVTVAAAAGEVNAWQLATKPAGHEYDDWQGSSLGIRIEYKDGLVYVKTIQDYVKKISPLEVGDQIVKIGDIDVSMLTMSQVGRILKSMPPDSRLDATLTRDDKELQVELVTVRHQLVDIAEIVQRLKSNAIIEAHLEATDRPEFMVDVTQRMVEAVQSSNSPREAYEGINGIIDEIGVSHTALIPEQAYKQLTGGESADLGLTLQRHQIGDKPRYFVIDSMPGSSGYDSKIGLGDELVSFNGVPVQQSSRLILAGEEHRHEMFFIKVEPGEEIQVEYRRRQNGQVAEVTLKAREAVPAIDVLGLSARVIDSNGNRIGYLRFWNLMSMKTGSVFKRIQNEKFENCHAIILDLRGRGGLIPVVLGMDKTVKEIKVPVIAITDDLTRSAKEMLSLLLKKHQHVTVIGQKTAGAVTGATMAKLPSGNALMFPAASSEMLKRFTNGVILEGVGVEPDIHFDFQIPYCGGNDRLIEAAVETVDNQISEFLKTMILP